MNKPKIFYGPKSTGKRAKAKAIGDENHHQKKVYLDAAYFLGCVKRNSWPLKMNAFELLIITDCPKDYPYHLFESIIEKGITKLPKIIDHKIDLIFLSNHRPSNIPANMVSLFDIRRFTKIWSIEAEAYIYTDYAVKNISKPNKIITYKIIA